MIKSILSFFNNGWVGATIGILGILVAIIFYIKSKTKKVLSIQKGGYKIIGKEQNNLPDNVQIYFKKKLVTQLSKTIIILWNSGNYTIDKEDILEKDQICLEFSENSEILSNKIITKTRDIINPILIKKEDIKNILYINFDFLDHNDGFIIEIIHTDTKKYPKIKGTIKGIPQGISDKGYLYNRNEENNFKFDPLKTKENIIFGIFLLIFGLISLILSFLPIDILNKVNNNDIIFFKIFGFVSGILFIFISFLMLIVFRKKFPKKLLIFKE